MALNRIVTDDPNAGTANRAALDAATGYSPLPPATIFTDGPMTATASNNGLTLRGDDTVLQTTQQLGGQYDRAALLLRCGRDGLAAVSNRGDETPDRRGTVLPAGQVGWHFDGNELQPVGGVVTRILPGQAIPQTLEFMRAFRGVPFTTGRTEFAVPVWHGLMVGEDIMATDGPTINEIIAEFRRVVAVTSRTVTLDQPLRRMYRQGTFVRGPFPARQSFHGLTFSGQLGTVLLSQAVDVQFNRFNVAKPPDFDPRNPNNRFSIMSCGRVTVSDGDLTAIDGIGLGHGHDARIIDCTGNCIMGEQCQIRTLVERCRFNWLDAWQQCHSWIILDCEFAGGIEQTLGVYDHWQVERVRCNGTVRVRGQNAFVNDLRTNGVVIVTPEYPAKHGLSAKNVVLRNVEAERIELWPGSSGRLENCSGWVQCDPATKASWTRDGRPLA